MILFFSLLLLTVLFRDTELVIKEEEVERYAGPDTVAKSIDEEGEDDTDKATR